MRSKSLDFNRYNLEACQVVGGGLTAFLAATPRKPTPSWPRFSHWTP